MNNKNEDSNDIKKNKNQIKLRVFEEDDYFEEFEEDKIDLVRIKSEEMKKWKKNWEDEEINDNFESILHQELTKTAQN